MLSTIFLIAAIIGGTVMVCQFILTLLGMGHHGDVLGGDLHDGDLSGDHSGGEIPAGGDHADAAHAHADSHTLGDWLFGVLTLRTLVAAVAFFGIAGKATLAAGKSDNVALIVALVAGVAAMYGVYALMRAIYSLQSDGTLNIRNSLGQRGSVYIPIAGRRQSAGKLQLRMQGRLVELAAMTDHDQRLATGVQVEVIEVIGPRMVLVAPVAQPASSPPAAHQDMSAGTDVGA
jgi:hypothetical protein